MAQREVLNLTDDDLNNEFSLAEPGWYKVEVEEVEEKAVAKEGANKGKPWYKFTLASLDEEAYKGKFFANVMCFAGAHFDLVAISKATGLLDSAGNFEVPAPEAFEGKELEVYITHREYTTKEGEQAKGHNVKRYRAVGGDKGKAPAKGKAKTAKGGFSL